MTLLAITKRPHRRLRFNSLSQLSQLPLKDETAPEFQRIKTRPQSSLMRP